VADVDPDLIVEEVRPLDDSAWAAELAFTAWFWVVLGMGSVPPGRSALQHFFHRPIPFVEEVLDVVEVERRVAL
jgi:hypothetical protein